MKDIAIIAKDRGVNSEDSARLVKVFGGPFRDAGEILAEYKNIKVKDESDTETMAEARKKRLILANVRFEVENNRKDLKSDILKQGRAIDSVARIIKDELIPAEEYLKTQEKFAELKQAERKAKKIAERVELLSKFTDSLERYNFEDMSDDDFKALVKELQAAKEHEIQVLRQAEKDRADREKAEAEDREKIRKENEQLKIEAEKQAKFERFQMLNFQKLKLKRLKGS